MKQNRSRLIALLLALCLLASALPLIALAEGSIQTRGDYDGAVTRVQDALTSEDRPAEKTNQQTITRTYQVGSIVARDVEGEIAVNGANEFTLPVAGKLTLRAADSANAYRWQVSVGGVWANIEGENTNAINLTVAKLQNALSGGDVAYVRCVLTDGDGAERTATAKVTIDRTIETETQEEAKQLQVTSYYQETPIGRAKRLNSANAPVNPTTYSIVINYVFADGTQAAPSWTATVATGSTFTQGIQSPTVVGYEADQKTVHVNASAETTITVIYNPALVNFTVKHYVQNINDDKYTLAATDSETKQGYTDSEVGANLAKTKEGFYVLPYDTTTKIAADGSTVVEIYYDRNYYLMNFDLDGGYGVEPIYARYGAQIGDAGTPTKPGYTFEGWDKTIPTTMPAQNTSYTASWKAATAGFTVVFWYENADDNGYSVAGTYTPADVATGTQKSSGDYKDQNFAGRDDTHFTYDVDKAETVTVAGDGSTVLDVYYTRNTYTLNFFYAKSTGSGNNTAYSVVGGTTYYFGNSGGVHGNIDANSTLAQLLAATPEDQWGRVQSKPTLNSMGADRYTLGTKVFSETTYYYLSFTAKYMQDLTNLWPVDIFNSVPIVGQHAQAPNIKNAYFAGWNGEYKVKYSRENANQTIKGLYKYLDDKLLYKEGNESLYDGDRNIYYLGFWDNGANIGWSIPRQWRYQLWLEPLAGQNYENTVTYNGKTYYLSDTIITYDDNTSANNGLSQQTPPALNGFHNIGRELGDQGTVTVGNDTLDYYTAKFYYTRNSYNLKFYNYNDFVADEGGSVQYEAPLKGYDFTPDYPADLEANAYVFDGWYTTAGCYAGTEVNFETMTMPASDVVLYARWTPKTHTVKTYLTKDAMDSGEDPLNTWEHVPHGTKLPQGLSIPDNGNYSFVGWFYISETGEERAYEQEIPINRDLNLYAKWSSNKLMEYTIYYQLADGTKIAPPTKGSALAGTTKTFDAKIGTDLNEGYQTGYYPNTPSHSLTIDIADSAKNEYTFVYVPAEKVKYTVRYLEKDTNVVLHEEKQAETSAAIITETFVQIAGYAPDAYQKRLVLSVDEKENVITFWYVKDNVHAPVQVIHWAQNIEGDGYTEIRNTTNLNGVIGNTYSETPLVMDGFKYNGTKSTSRGMLTAEGLVLNLYYDRIEYPYEFRFLEQGTDKVLADPVTGAARYQKRVTQDAMAIPGYTLVSAEHQAIDIAIEDGNTAVKNVKTFYYTEQMVEIKYEVVGDAGCGTLDNYQETQLKVVTGTVKGSLPTAADDYRFVGWYKDADCTELVDASWIVDNKLTPAKTANIGTDTEGAPIMAYEGATYYAKFERATGSLTITKTGYSKYASLDPNQSFLFTVSGGGLNGQTIEVVIHGNGSVTIQDLPCGEYTVTENTAWSWRYTPDSNGKTANVTGGETKTVTFNNDRKKDKWLDGNAYCDNKWINGGSTVLSN